MNKEEFESDIKDLKRTFSEVYYYSNENTAIGILLQAGKDNLLRLEDYLKDSQDRLLELSEAVVGIDWVPSHVNSEVYQKAEEYIKNMEKINEKYV